MDLPKSDPEIAADKFQSDLAIAMQSDLAIREGWELIPISLLTVVLKLTARRKDAPDERYYLKLVGDWYDQYPPQVTFVSPQEAVGWPSANPTSRWFPNLTQTDPGFKLHSDYGYPGESVGRQLICSSINADYYMSQHNPEPGKGWEQGRDNLIWTLSVIQSELTGEGYLGPVGAADN